MYRLPGDDDFFVDGKYAELILDLKALTGTSVQADALELVDAGLSLPYDGQTANFTNGARVTGYNFSGKGAHAHGTIVNDVDGGATGTLTLKEVEGIFEDNMVLVDDNGTPGKALVNSATGGTPAKLTGGIWATTGAVTGVGITSIPFTNPGLAAGDGDLRVVSPREFRIEYTFVSVTDADYAVDIGQAL